MDLSAFAKIANYLSHPLVLVGFIVFLFFSIQKILIKSKILPPVSQRASSKVVLLILKYGFWLAFFLILLGFGLEYYKVKNSMLLSIDTQFIVKKLLEKHKAEIENYKISQKTSEVIIKNLTGTIASLAEQT